MTIEMPFAMVQGQPLTVVPEDLYIPPDALEVFLDAFEGPLDLLLYLIKRQNLDILDIPIAQITQQYIGYIEMMGDMRLELAAEYLVMAAMLAEIKSRMLLPRQDENEEGEDDPRAELVRRLQEYERYKNAALNLDELPRYGRDVFWGSATLPELEQTRPQPEISFDQLMDALRSVLNRTEVNAHHQIQRETLSIRERMTDVLSRLQTKPFMEFAQLFSFQEGRMGVVVTFIAILELTKQSLIDIVQSDAYSPIHVKALGQE